MTLSHFPSALALFSLISSTAWAQSGVGKACKGQTEIISYTDGFDALLQPDKDHPDLKIEDCTTVERSNIITCNFNGEESFAGYEEKCVNATDGAVYSLDLILDCVPVKEDGDTIQYHFENIPACIGKSCNMTEAEEVALIMFENLQDPFGENVTCSVNGGIRVSTPGVEDSAGSITGMNAALFIMVTSSIAFLLSAVVF